MTTLDVANDGSDRPPEKSGAFKRLKDFLRPLFLRVRDGLSRGAPAPSWERSFRVLRHHGIRPVTVFDIGVAYAPTSSTGPFPTPTII